MKIIKNYNFPPLLAAEEIEKELDKLAEEYLETGSIVLESNDPDVIKRFLEKTDRLLNPGFYPDNT